MKLVRGLITLNQFLDTDEGKGEKEAGGRERKEDPMDSAQDPNRLNRLWKTKGAFSSELMCLYICVTLYHERVEREEYDEKISLRRWRQKMRREKSREESREKRGEKRREKRGGRKVQDEGEKELLSGLRKSCFYGEGDEVEGIASNKTKIVQLARMLYESDALV